MAIAVRHQRGQRRIIISISDTLDAGAVRAAQPEGEDVQVSAGDDGGGARQPAGPGDQVRQ